MKKRFWIGWTARRYLFVKRKEKSRASLYLSVAGIAVGVMTLITVIGVMNGFQQGFINNLNEISSFHVRISGPEGSPLDKETLKEITGYPGTVAVVEFSDLQAMIQGEFSSPRGALIRAVDPDIYRIDPGLRDRITIEQGSFDLSEPGSIVLGSELSRRLRVIEGDTVSVMTLIPDGKGRLIPRSIDLKVVGVFKSGYYEIDDTFSYISLKDGRDLFGISRFFYGIKIKNHFHDKRYSSGISKRLPPFVEISSWRDFNRSFFSALLMEKIMMMLVLGLIFIVVAVNIYQSLKRSVLERTEELALLKAVGARPGEIRMIFLLEGIIISVAGGIAGLMLGLLISLNINGIFGIVEAVVNFFMRLVRGILPMFPGSDFTIYSSTFFYLTEVPVKLMAPDLIVIFSIPCVFSVLAAFLATGRVSMIKPAEVLRYE